MNRRSSSTRRLQASQVFVLPLLVLAYLTQPVLALGSSWATGHGCEVEVSCCCEAPQAGMLSLAVVPAADDGDCCSDGDSDEDTVARAGGAVALERETAAATREGDCGCRAQRLPVRGPEPVLPATTLEAAGLGSSLEWLRVHSRLSARTPCRVPELASPPGVASAAARSGPLGRGSTWLRAGDLAGAGAWTLLEGGVPGLLALLSVALL